MERKDDKDKWVPSIVDSHVEALHREHPYDPELIGTDPSEPLRLGIVAGNQSAGPLHKPQPVEPILAELDLEDGEKWYTVRGESV